MGRTKTIDECGCCGGDASCCVCTLWMISHLVPTWPLCHPEIVQMTDLSGVILQENTDYCDPDAQCPYSILGKQKNYIYKRGKHCSYEYYCKNTTRDSAG